MPTIGVVRSTMQQTHSTATSTTATRTTTIRQILIVYVPFGVLQQNILLTLSGNLSGSVFQKKRKMQLSLFDIPKPKVELEELFNAYFECRKNK